MQSCPVSKREALVALLVVLSLKNSEHTEFKRIDVFDGFQGDARGSAIFNMVHD